MDHPDPHRDRARPARPRLVDGSRHRPGGRADVLPPDGSGDVRHGRVPDPASRALRSCCGSRCSVAGLDPRTLAVGGAFTAVVFGLAAQQTLGNLIAGMVLLSARPFRVGERVRLQAGAVGGSTEGVVSSLGLLYTTLARGRGPDHDPEQRRARRRRRPAARAGHGRREACVSTPASDRPTSRASSTTTSRPRPVRRRPCCSRRSTATTSSSASRRRRSGRRMGPSSPTRSSPRLPPSPVSTRSPTRTRRPLELTRSAGAVSCRRRSTPVGQQRRARHRRVRIGSISGSPCASIAAATASSKAVRRASSIRRISESVASRPT